MEISKIQFATIVAISIIFLASLFYGFTAGTTLGQAKATYNNVDVINSALKYYFSDQDTYPSVDQFYNKKILASYYLNFQPKPADANGICRQAADFNYSQSSPRNFSLSFCLSTAVNGLSAGTHTLTDKGLVQ